MTKYQTLANKIGELVDEKNKAYGNSFGEVGDFLRILYPNGIPPEAYTDALCIVRIFDKLKRIATAKDAFGESPYQDIVGYALLGTQKDVDKRIKMEQERLGESDKEFDKECFPSLNNDLTAKGIMKGLKKIQRATKKSK